MSVFTYNYQDYIQMPIVNVDYTCPCCGFRTRNKAHMRKHFYEKLKPCPKQVNVIDLTDEIKRVCFSQSNILSTKANVSYTTSYNRE